MLIWCMQRCGRYWYHIGGWLWSWGETSTFCFLLRSKQGIDNSWTLDSRSCSFIESGWSKMGSTFLLVQHERKSRWFGGNSKQHFSAPVHAKVESAEGRLQWFSKHKCKHPEGHWQSGPGDLSRWFLPNPHTLRCSCIEQSMDDITSYHPYITAMYFPSRYIPHACWLWCAEVGASPFRITGGGCTAAYSWPQGLTAE